MHCSGMRVIINAWSLAVISYDEIEGKGQTTHVMLMVTHTKADGYKGKADMVYLQVKLCDPRLSTLRLFVV